MRQAACRKGGRGPEHIIAPGGDGGHSCPPSWETPGPQHQPSGGGSREGEVLPGRNFDLSCCTTQS